MLSDRQNEILRYLSEVSYAKVEQLSEIFDVSIETIRRDLLDLEKEGSINRVRGGASYNAMRAREIDFDKKKENHQAEKQAIVRTFIEYIKDYEAIMLSNGSVNIRLAHLIAEQRQNMTIITNSIEAAAILNENPTHRVILTGGEMRKLNKSLVGSACLDSLDNYRTDKAVVNVDGVSLEEGVMECFTEEAAVIRKMLAKSRMKIILCESKTFNEVALNAVCPIDNIDMIFTDDRISAKEVKVWEENGVRVIPAQK